MVHSPNKHPSPLYNLLMLYQLTNSKIETVRGRASKSCPTLVLGLVVLWVAPPLHSSALLPTLPTFLSSPLCQ